jgi:hypothetical protein
MADWTQAQLGWYKAMDCFTKIVRYQTRMLLPVSDAALVFGE